MRINVYIAQATGLSRRSADKAIAEGRVIINDHIASIGESVNTDDSIKLDEKLLLAPQTKTLVALNKPRGYVVSRKGQGAKTIYDLLPEKYHVLKPVGRLDKDSSGLLLLTNDGKLAQNLTHPSAQKNKVYLVGLNLPLKESDANDLNRGIQLVDGLSRLSISGMSNDRKSMTVTISEGRNRQIRRTFAALQYRVNSLHRIRFGEYDIKNLKLGEYLKITD